MYIHSLRFNGHFPGEPGLAGVCWSKGWWRWWRQLDYWSYVVQSPSQIITINKPTSSFFTGRMPFLSPNQQCQSTEGKISHSTDLLTSSSPEGLPTLSLTTTICQFISWVLLIYKLLNTSTAKYKLLQKVLSLSQLLFSKFSFHGYCWLGCVQ